VGSQRITAWAMARPKGQLNYSEQFNSDRVSPNPQFRIRLWTWDTPEYGAGLLCIFWCDTEMH
jgi:hypothetical protein